MRAATEGSLPPVMPQGNLVEVLGREVRQGSPGELMVESTPSSQRRPPCKTNKEESDEASDAAALTYLLTTRQWDPLGLARWLPSFGVGAWRSAPLLPWRVQCSGRVCAALAAGSGGPGRCLVSCLPRFPLLAPRAPRCVWRALPFGCPLPSPAGTPFHAVCAFRELGPVALLVFPACPLCVCALALPRRPRPPPPPPAGVARAPHAVPALGAGRAVQRGLCPSACPALFPCSVWRAWGGAARFRFPPTWLGVCAPRGAGLRVREVPVPGGGVGGGGGQPVRCAPRLCGLGGQWGGGLLCLAPSLCLPWAGNKSGVTCVVLVMEGVASISLRFVWRPGALAQVGLFSAVPVGAGGWGGGAGLAPAPLSGAAIPPGGGGTSPLPRGGGDRRPLWLAGRWGGGSRRGPPALPLGGGLRFPPLPPPRRRRIPPPACAFGRGPGAAPCTGCGLPGGGGGGGLLVDRSPRGSDRPNPSLRPPRVGNQCSGHWGRGPHTVPVHCRVPLPGIVRASLRRAGAGSPVGRDPRGSRRWGAPGRAACGSSCVPPQASQSLLGEGGRPLGLGGAEGRRSCGSQAGGGGGGGGRSAAPRSPARLGGPWPPPLSSFVPGAPPLGILVLWGWLGGSARRARPGRPPVGHCGGGGEGGGGRGLLALARAPAFPRPASESAAPFALSWVLLLRCRSVAGNAGACGRSTGGDLRAAALAAAAVFPPLGAAAPPGGCGAAVSPAGLRPLLGGGGGGEGGAPWSSDAALRRPRGDGLAVLALGGQPSAGGAHSSPAPLYPVRAGPSRRPSLGSPAPLAVAAQRRLAWGGGGRAGGWWGRL